MNTYPHTGTGGAVTRWWAGGAPAKLAPPPVGTDGPHTRQIVAAAKTIADWLVMSDGWKVVYLPAVADHPRRVAIRTIDLSVSCGYLSLSSTSRHPSKRAVLEAAAEALRAAGWTVDIQGGGYRFGLKVDAPAK
jgi:hypothetical protein